MAEQLTEEEYNSINYFHFEKTIDSWVGWEECKKKCKRVCPELLDAIDRLYSARRTLDIIVGGLDYEREDYG